MPESTHGLAPGLWLRQRREAAGLTQEELAHHAGLSVRAISNLERDRTRRPHADSLRRIAKSLGLPEAAVTELVASSRAGGLVAAAAPQRAGPDGGLAAAAASAAGAYPARGPVVIPRQLPAAVAPFAGRAAELAILNKWLAEAQPGARQAVGIAAITGMAGVGKTALAVHWAHRVADQFPDGQLYADLRGYDPDGQPTDAAQVVHGFLQALGVAAEQIPAALDGQTALYRSVLTGRRMLVVADNARNAAQVRPLLPGEPGSLLVVTSRSQLTGLVAAEGARLVTLDVLSEADAAGLLAARLGFDRVEAEADAVADLARLCGGLPLALAIVAARAELSGWPLGVFARQLLAAEDRLEALGLDDPAADLRALFSWSCRQLSDECERMFRLLAAHPGPDVSVATTASLAGVSASRAAALLRELASACLATERVPGRYSMHDLLRAYARTHRRVDGRDTGGSVILEHYLRTAMDAARLLDPAHRPAGKPPGPGATRERLFTEHQALAWFDAEYSVLLALIAEAAASGPQDYACQLASTLEPLFTRRSNWQDLALTQRTALDCSVRLGQLDGQARAHLQLGRALARLGQADLARAHVARAVELSAELGDRGTEARAHLVLAAIWQTIEHKSAEAIASSLRALALAEADADPGLTAVACNNLGYDHALHGDAARALAYCRRALDLCQQANVDPVLEGHIYDTLGYASQRLGEHQQAIASYRRATRIFRDNGARYLSAESLSNLGDCQAAAGDADAAIRAWQHALTILDDLGDAGAGLLCDKIGRLRKAM